jgi:integrase
VTTTEKVNRLSQRAISSVNRELELLRAMFSFAVREGWITRSPFESGYALISKADETKRDKILNFEEEIRLIKALDTPRRRHILPLVLTAIDTAMRRGELFKLQWKDVDLESGLILIQATNTKTQTERIVGLTPRVIESLICLYETALDKQNGLVFGITDTIKNGWKSACQDAGIKGLRFHDLRHTAITRMVGEGLPTGEIMNASGHTQMATFQRYVNPSTETAKRNAARLANYHAARMNELLALKEKE